MRFLKSLRSLTLAFSLVTVGLATARVTGDDWLRFRGPNGSGISQDAQIPTQWSDDSNLAWKTPLPGPGSSSPIVVGDLVFVTCYTGYGVDLEQPGSPEQLQRHLIAFDLKTGTEKWSAKVASTAREDGYRGFITEHGYASSTPVSDGKKVFVFFGKAGVVAYDLSGKQLWQTSVGQESGNRRWGSGTSPILHGNLVIVNASEESSALVALDQETGKEVWRAEADGMNSSWSTPIVVTTDSRSDIVFGVPNEVWGVNAQNGKLKWYAQTIDDNSYCSSLVTDGQHIFGIEGRSAQAFAVKVGGDKDVTQSHVAWKTRGQNRICTPVWYEGRLYTVSRGIAQSFDAATGKQLYQKRLGSGAEAADDSAGRPARRRGGSGGQDYSSPIVVNGNLYFTQRSGLTHVWKTGPDFELLAQNRFDSDESKFNGTPAVSPGRLLIRSDRCLYCIAKP